MAPDNQDPIQNYVQAILKEGKLDTLPDDLRIGLEEQLTVLVYQRIGTLMVNELGDAASEQFFSLLEKNPLQPDHVQLNQFLSDHIEHFDTKLADSLADLGADFLQRLKTNAASTV